MSAEAITLPTMDERRDDRISLKGTFEYTCDCETGEAGWSSTSHDGACISLDRYLRPGRLIRIEQDGHELLGMV